jgi:hypothetical protein
MPSSLHAYKEITHVSCILKEWMVRAQAVLVEALEASPHMEHMARWLQVMGVVHSASIQQRRAELMPILRRLNKVRTPDIVHAMFTTAPVS